MNHNHWILKNYTALFYVLFSVGLLFSFMYANNQILSGDQTQMLYKGYMGAYQGVWISYGNEASAVGNVPGSLSSYVIGVPLMLVDSPWSPMVFLIFLHVLSFFLLDAVIKNIFSAEVRLLFVVLYWLNPWFLFESFLYNPSYLFFFAALHFWSAFKMSKSKHFIYSFLHLLSIGMALQLHYSWILLALISLYLFYKRIIFINWYGIATSALVIIISLVPYIQEFLSNESIRTHQNDGASDRYIGWGGVHVYPVLKSLLYWLRYGSFIFTNKLVTGAGFEWISSSDVVQMIFQYIYRVLIFVVGAASIVIAFLANRYLYLQVKTRIFKQEKEVVEDKVWLFLYLVGVVFAILISAILSPIVFNYWHLMMIFPFAILPVLLYAQTSFAKFQQYYTALVLLLSGYFIVINLVAMHDSEKFSYKVNYSQQTDLFIKKHIQY